MLIIIENILTDYRFLSNLTVDTIYIFLIKKNIYSDFRPKLVDKLVKKLKKLIAIYKKNL